MTAEVFIDTGAFYSLLDHRDRLHDVAKSQLQVLEATRHRFITTDYVLDETATLFQSRKLAVVVGPWLDDLFFQAVVSDYLDERRSLS